MSKCNIAICLSGEPRLSNLSSASIKRLKAFCYKQYGADVNIDVFYHFWDSVTENIYKQYKYEFDRDNVKIKYANSSDLKNEFEPTIGVCESKEELNDPIDKSFNYIHSFLTKDFIIKPTYFKGWCSYFKDLKVFRDIVKYTNIPTLSQVISLCKCQLLRLKYEKNHNIKYDLIIRTRSDIEIKLPECDIISYCRRPKMRMLIQFPFGNIDIKYHNDPLFYYTRYVDLHFQCCFFLSTSHVLVEGIFDNYVEKIYKQMFSIDKQSDRLGLLTDHQVIPQFFASQGCKFKIPLDGIDYRLIH